MTVKIIQKYKKYKTSQLIKIATTHFNKFIRTRDAGKRCISCNSLIFSDAGHFYSAGHYPTLRFNENNVHGQCKRCNYFLSGNLNKYRINLIERIGIDKVEKLDQLAAISKRTSFKWNRIDLINIIEIYKNK